MKTEELEKLVSSKMFLINSFLHTVALPAGHGPDSSLKLGVTKYYLRSVILELLIKVLYELYFREQAPFTHNLLKIFDSLKEDTKEFVLSSYDEARKRLTEVFNKADKTVTFPQFQDVLAANENFIKNFKYDAMASKSNSAADKAFYDSLVQKINETMEKIKNA